MSDLAVRISILIQEGHICQICGTEIDGTNSGAPRPCSDCQCLATANKARSKPR